MSTSTSEGIAIGHHTCFFTLFLYVVTNGILIYFMYTVKKNRKVPKYICPLYTF